VTDSTKIWTKIRVSHRSPTTGAGRRIDKVGEQREGTKIRLPRGPQKDIVISLLITPICLTISASWRHCDGKRRLQGRLETRGMMIAWTLYSIRS
jgi:hypothetical protein